jgi:phage-related protein
LTDETEKVASTGSNIAGYLSNCAQNVISAVQNAGSALVEYAGNAVQTVASIGSNIAGYLSNFVSNLDNCAQNVTSTVQNTYQH